MGSRYKKFKEVVEKLLSKEAKLAVIGLGYVGLPIALEFARKVKVVGFDINAARVDMMKNNQDPSGELDSSEFEGCDILFTADPADLEDVQFFIVAVPTPIDENNLPNLTPLLSASHTVGKVISKGDYIVYESTVYPGCTEEDCVPILEQESGLKFVDDFFVGFSPERINPGDKEHTLSKIVKVSAGCTPESSKDIADVYRLVIDAGVHEASSIKVAEAAKIIENTQRDVNIALMNELSMICGKLDINTYEVLEAAGTKWNFLNFTPGLVGGHCIGVDPYYLTYKAQKLGHEPKVILSGRSINDGMGYHIAKTLVKDLLKKGKNANDVRVLIMGGTFKENVEDIRNSKVVDVIDGLRSFSVTVDIVDPYASNEEFEEEYGHKMIDAPEGMYDAVIVAVGHDKYAQLTEGDFQKLVTEDGIFVDIKGIFRGKIASLDYWSL